MNWEAIGAVGEIVGALGVILTLFYLSFQIRQNTRAIKGQTLGTVTQNNLTEVMPFVGPNPTEAWIKAMNDPSQLTELEHASLDAWMIASFQIRQNEFAQYKLGALDESVWRSTHRPIEENLGHEYGRNWWKNYGKPRFMPEFVEFVESLNWQSKDSKIVYRNEKSNESDT